MSEINMDNIIGSRTRGKNIDWQEAEQKLKDEGENDAGEDDEDEDDDFVDPDDDDAMKD